MSTIPNPIILSTGNAIFPRYVILAEDSVATSEKRYWTGEQWTGDLRSALLYAKRDVACQEMMRITADQPDS